ncbi:MAG: polyprenyl diphosphate synthase [Xanthomonadales bacterium]|nr:polyprenyl diphosphate synthase [Xanthomonadales bacterium]
MADTAATTPVLQHLALIMDGNGRWASARGLPRSAGHQMGRKALKNMVRACAKRQIPQLTVFAFSSENWRRPENEVKTLLQLFMRALQKEVPDLHKNNIRVRFMGDPSRFPEHIQQGMVNATQQTEHNTGMCLNIAVNYGGHWDITQAAQRALAESEDGQIRCEDIERQLSLGPDTPPPDLLIRTGGERRVSNFMLWQLAYAELYFCDTLWPDFKERDLDHALADFARRERRFGCVPQADLKQAHA